MTEGSKKAPATRPRLVSAKQAAQELGIPYTSLREAAFRREIPVIRLGRAWYFEREDLERFIKQAKQLL
jgi:excisionase family DNA binding protein